MKKILAIFMTVAMLMATLAVVIGAEEVTIETVETEAVETEVMETEPPETEPVETEPVETEPAETEPVETETAETEPAGTEPAGTEPTESEPAGTEPAGTEPTESEPAGTEPTESEPAGTEPAETEPVETEPMETAPTESEPAETASVQAAAPVEPVTTVKEPPATEPETSTSLIPSDVANALIHATPEQLEAVKQYLEKGINVLEEKTGWDRVTDFLLEHVEELAWMVCAIAFVACMCVVLTAKKKFGLSASTMNNNAVEIAEKSERAVESMKREAMEACREMKEQASMAATQAGDAFDRFSAADEKNAHAVSCLAVVVDELLQVSNLPQWKRDEIQMKFNEAMSHVESHESGVSGDDAEG